MEREHAEEAEQRQARSRARKDQQNTVTLIEKEIATLESRQQEIHESLQSAETYANTLLFAELNRELKTIDTKLERLHQQWEAEATKLEQLA